jgi:hypothetical protein
MADKPDIFSAASDMNVQAFVAMTKATGLGSAVLIQGVAGRTTEPSSESVAIVHTADLSRVMEKALANTGRELDIGFVVGKRGAGKSILPSLLRSFKRSSTYRHEDFECLVIDPSLDAVGTVPSEKMDVEPRLLDIIRAVLPEGRAIKTTARDLLRNKAVAALVNLIDQVDEQTALEALSAPDDLSVLTWFLASPAAAGLLAKSTHPLAASLMRGVERRRQLLAMEEGTASGQEFADALGISRQAIDKRRRAGDLLAVPTGSGDWRYPWWQLQEGRVLPGFEEVMVALGELSPWSRMDFFLSSNERLGGRRPLDALRKGGREEVDFVIQSARAEGEQGAV